MPKQTKDVEKNSDINEDLAKVEKKYFIFRRQLKTFLEALKHYMSSSNTCNSNQVLRTVKEMEDLMNQSTQPNATYRGVMKLWFEVYDDLRELIHKQVVAAQESAPEVPDEVLKIRVTEALEFVNELTQPTHDVVQDELDCKMKSSLEDMRHDELFQMNFSERKQFGCMACLLPLALDALAHASNLNNNLVSGARSAIQSRQQEEENRRKQKSSSGSIASRSNVGSRGSFASTTSSKKPAWRPSGPVTPQIKKTSSIL